MYRDGLDDKIHAGPGWDFDIAFANRKWGNWMGERFYSPQETMVRRQEKKMPREFYEAEGIEGGYEAGLMLSRIVFDLMEIPEFQEEVGRVFQERMSGRREELVKKVLDGAKRIYVAAKGNEEKWVMNDFETELTSMIDWIRARYDYFEQEYGDMGTQVNNML